jgi:hypothetical protein
MSNKNLIKSLLRNPVSFNPVFSEITGNIAAGVFLSQCYWITENIVEEGSNGWFWRRQSQFERETSFTNDQQQYARNRLIKLNILEEKLVGFLPILHFRLNMEVLFSLLEENAQTNADRFKAKKPSDSRLKSPPNLTTYSISPTHQKRKLKPKKRMYPRTQITRF